MIFINNDFIRELDELSLNRTAYWHKLDKIVVSKFNLWIIYQSGTSELFKLPYLQNKKLEYLKNILKTKSEEHNVTFQEKPWWKFF